MIKKVMITGATGFIGNALFRHLLEDEKYDVLTIARDIKKLQGSSSIQISDLTSDTNWSDVFQHNIDTIVHCAARVHVMNDTSEDPLAEFRCINVGGTLKLAQEAVKNGVRRFIFISSIKVNGESTTNNKPFKASDKPNPSDPYGISKYETEQALLQLARESNLEVVIIRPVLVYGPNVKGNFQSLLKLSSTNLPLPFGSIHNLRSMIYLGNLVDFIIHCIHHPNVKNKTFLISDGHDLSISSLITQIRKAQNRPSRLLPIPISIFQLIGKLVGKTEVINRLIGNLQVDATAELKEIGWVPLYTVEQGIEHTVKSFTQRMQ